MSTSSRTTRDVGPSYSLARQALHWVSALLIVAAFVMGFTMARTGADSLRSTLYGTHAAVGVLITVLAIVRIVLARRGAQVVPPPGLAHWNRTLRSAVQSLALFLPLLLAVTGLVTLAANGLLTPKLHSGLYVPPELADARAQTAHHVLAWVYLSLLAIHVAGVVRYQATKGDALGRMGVRGAPARGTDRGSR